MKQVLISLLARLGAAADRHVIGRVDHVAGRVDQAASTLDDMTSTLDGLRSAADSLRTTVDAMAARLDAMEASMGSLQRAVEDLAAIPALSTELVDGIAEAEARAAGRLAEVERLLAGRG